MFFLFSGLVARKEVRYAGILLLVTVVVRLGVVDIWNMESIWKIVTFLGIGLQFITALIEKPFRKVIVRRRGLICV